MSHVSAAHSIDPRPPRTPGGCAARPRRRVAVTDGRNVSFSEKCGLHRSKARAVAAPFTAAQKRRPSAVHVRTGYCTQQAVSAESTLSKRRPRLEFGAICRSRGTGTPTWLRRRGVAAIALVGCATSEKHAHRASGFIAKSACTITRSARPRRHAAWPRRRRAHRRRRLLLGG